MSRHVVETISYPTRLDLIASSIYAWPIIHHVIDTHIETSYLAVQ